MEQGLNEATMNWKMKRIIRGMGPSKCLLAALLIVSAIFTLYIALAGGKISKQKLMRAESIRGVRCRLWPNKSTWQSDEIPEFKAYVLKPGSNDLCLATVISLGCQVQVDGLWYHWIGPKWTGAFGAHNGSDWLANVGGYLTVMLNKRHWQNVINSKLLTLKPGEHTVRFGWAGYRTGLISKIIHKDEPILLLSNAVKIQLLPSVTTDKEILSQDEWRQGVRDLFQSYVRKETVTDAEKQTGIKLDLRSFHFWQPKFTWVDIPILLELAESDRIMTERIPSLPISSYRQKECREGMVALWLIEGLREKQAALMRQSQTGEEPSSRTYYQLPGNPICVKEGMKFQNCENSYEIHQKVLQAYRRWWQRVKFLPPMEAAVFYPLDLLDLRWCGSSYYDEPLEIYKKMSTAGTIAQRTIRTTKYTDNDYQPGKVLHTIHYALKDPFAPPPFKKEMLSVRKVVLHFYDEDGRETQAKSIIPLSGQP